MDNPLVSTTLFTVCSAGGLEEGNGKDDPNVDMRTGETRFSCDACGASNLVMDDYDSPVRLMDVWRSRPKKWPDILRSCSSRLWAVDEKVAADMEAFGLTGYRLQKLVVEESIPPRKRPPKPYWAVIPTGRAAYLTSVHPEKPHDFCPKCGRFLSKPDDDDRLCCRLVDGSWDGSDWVLATHNNLRPDVVCSERVVECARTCGWKNAYFGVPPGAEAFALWKLKIDYHAENWRELLEFDVERASRDDLRNHGRPVEKASSGSRRPVPIYSPGFDPPSPKHPFDDLGEFDGYGWQGNANLSVLFGWGELDVCLDVPHPERLPDWKRPPKRLREVFDAFAANEKEIFPELDSILRKTLSGCGKVLPPECPGGLADFSGVLPPGAASIAINDPGQSDAGSVELNYSLDPDPPRRALTIRIGVDRKTKRLSVLSSEVD